MPRDQVVWENGKKYVVVNGFKFRSGYISAAERRQRAKQFNGPPLTVMGPSRAAVSASSPQAPDRQASAEE